MKRIVLVVTAVLVLVLGIMSCEPIARTERPDYTADQVIVVAQAQYPPYDRTTGSSYYNNVQTVTLTPSISVAYIGEGYWRVYISCPSGYRASGVYVGSNITRYFNETTGVLGYTQPD